MAVLRGLKVYPDLELSVIVSMADDGGSNAVVRDQFGLLPLSDLRKSIIALAGGDSQMLQKVFTYRFDKGNGLYGHTLGNLIMIGLTEITGSEIGAIQSAGTIFHTRGRVVPSTVKLVKLVAKYDDGSLVAGEHLIDEPSLENDRRIAEISLEPKAEAYPPAVQAIKEADFIITGPGDLYTTTFANLVVDGISEAARDSKGRLIFIPNLMTKHGQTHWMKAGDMVKEFTRYAKRKPDLVVLNNGVLPPEAVAKYLSLKEKPIQDDLSGTDFEVVRDDIVLDEEIKKDSSDDLLRSLIRHDHGKLARVLYEIINR